MLITSKEQIVKFYQDVFERIVKLPGPSYHIQLDTGVPPKQTPYHPIPVSAGSQQNVTGGKCLNMYKKPHHGLIALFL